MLVGDASQWADRFASIDDRLLHRIVAVWPRCLALLPTNPEEDLITRNLINLLLKDEETRQLVYWMEYQFHVWAFTVDGLALDKGIVDMAVLLDQERERYLAYECKRLNVVYRAGRQSLAGPYVSQGLQRFFSEQYAETLPVGAMLGYILDGDLSFATASVHASITGSATAIGLTDGPTVTTPIGAVTRFLTTHKRPSNHRIEVRHAFLPFASGKAASNTSGRI